MDKEKRALNSLDDMGDLFENDELDVSDVVTNVTQESEEEVVVEKANSSVASTEEEVVTTDKPSESIKEDNKKFYLSVYDLVSIVMSAFIIIALVFTFAFRLVGVDGQSMTNTLQHGDW